MPRNGSSIMSWPPNTVAIPDTTISSAYFNAFLADLLADLNAPRPIAVGGTGASSASAARSNLGLVIGTNVQAYDAGLASISGLTTAADQMLYLTAEDAYATTALTAFARTVLDDADAATARTTLGAAAVDHTHTLTDCIAGIIQVPVDGDYWLVINIPFAGTIKKTTTVTVSGTCTATFKVGTTQLGGTPNAASSTEESQTHETDNTFAVGDRIIVNMSEISSASYLSITIEYERTVPATVIA